MAVKRIIANLTASKLAEAERFYGAVLDMDISMDHGWIVTYTAPSSMVTQISIASEGGSGTPVPDISIEVDNLDEVLERAIDEGFVIVYGPAVEPWGVRRFYVRDPFGRLVNILTHV